MTRKWRALLFLPALLAFGPPLCSEELIWTWKSSYPRITIYGELECIHFDWLAINQSHDAISSCNESGCRMLWEEIRTGDQEFPEKRLLVQAREDCRYLAKKFEEDTKGAIIDLNSGKAIAQSQKLFGIGELHFAPDGQHIISTGYYEAEPEQYVVDKAYVTTLAGKRLAHSPLVDGIPVYGGKYYVGEYYISDARGRRLWKLGVDFRIGPDPMAPDWKTPYLGHSPILSSQRVTIDILALSSNGRYFIANDEADHQIYLGEWGNHGVARRASLPQIAGTIEISSATIYLRARRLYAFSPDSSSIAVLHFPSTGAAQVSLVDLRGQLIWEKTFDASEEFRICKASGTDYYRNPTSIRFAGNRIAMHWVKTDSVGLSQCHVSKTLSLSGAILYSRMDDETMRGPYRWSDSVIDRTELLNRLYLINGSDYVRLSPRFEGDKVVIHFYRGRWRGKDP